MIEGKLPTHPMEHYCSTGEGDPILGRTVEELLLTILHQNEDEQVRNAVAVGLYDLHALMMTLFELLDRLDSDDDLEISVTHPPLRFDA